MCKNSVKWIESIMPEVREAIRAAVYRARTALSGGFMPDGCGDGCGCWICRRITAQDAGKRLRIEVFVEGQAITARVTEMHGPHWFEIGCEYGFGSEAENLLTAGLALHKLQSASRSTEIQYLRQLQSDQIPKSPMPPTVSDGF